MSPLPTAVVLPLASFLSGSLGFLMGLMSLMLTVLILLQRGKGGGLVGALGGPGGQSAFGSKAGDTLTWITVGMASIWGVICAFATMQLGDQRTADLNDDIPAIIAAPGDEPVDGEPIDFDDALTVPGLTRGNGDNPLPSLSSDPSLNPALTVEGSDTVDAAVSETTDSDEATTESATLELTTSDGATPNAEMNTGSGDAETPDESSDASDDATAESTDEPAVTEVSADGDESP